ncbi:MAG: sodium:solute symporter family protein [Bacteroidales bacterium]|jgi:Na+/proline symporter|nr:sodium:solute symporter family protein [Bacteroidales bacterium]
MILARIDWAIVFSFFVLSLLIGIYSARKAGKSASEFFLSNRNMPWWLLGVSMVATTFSCDTPNLVTDIVRQDGVYGNWAWWAFLLTGMLTVFIYAKLWRRSGVMTDLEFYEIRYSGKIAAFLRGFRAIYLGAFFNIFIIATVSLALIKISAVMLQWPPVKTILIASLITVIYSTLGGLRGILLTDFFQFFMSMAGAIGAAIIVLKMPEVGGMEGLVSHPEVIPKLRFLPDFSNTEALITLLVLPLAVQWWSVWYPGAEPGGGGYIAQRMLSARNEKGSIQATLFFNVAHYALRPWPWIIVALGSVIIFPDLISLQQTFPNIDPQLVKHDLAYPAMLSMLPKGLLGLVVASLIAAYMSTVSTQLNWGASYLVNDFYQRFVNTKASEKQLVRAGRLFTVLLMLLAGLFTLILSNALQAFHIILQIGAGTGLIFILRWFWWRINALSEITAMVVSFLVALFLQFVYPHLGYPPLSGPIQMLIGVFITTMAWLSVALLTRPTDDKTLIRFYRLVQPGGPGWKKMIARARKQGVVFSDEKEKSWDVPAGILCMVIGAFAIYSALFATGYWIYGQYLQATILTFVSILAIFALLKLWSKLKIQ